MAHPLKNKTFAVVLVAVALTISCSQKPKAVEVLPPVPSAIDAKLLNEAALFLAGLPGGPHSHYHDAESTPAWAQYAKGFNQTWATAEKEQFAAINEFETRELKPSASGNSFLFYPFSGPDVLYATQFFPRSTLYVMAGLEPVGNLSMPAEYRKEDLPAELNGLSIAAASIFKRSFFVTGEMSKHFGGRTPVTNGLLPVMLLLLARSGSVIDGVQLGGITLQGTFEVQPLTQPKHEAVEIVFHAATGGPRKTLYYASTDLGENYDPQKGFGRFVTLHGQHDTLIKSASFLLHWRPFLTLRRQILETSSLILQDDTGVPYRELQKNAWQVKLYGKYSSPDKPFTNQYQKDLAAAFSVPENAHELGFSIGYGYHRRPSSLIVATHPSAKLNAAASLPVAPKGPTAN